MDDQGFVRQPLSASFLVLGVVGFFVSLYAVVYLAFDLTWGLLLMLIFAIFALAALKSIRTRATAKKAMSGAKVKKSVGKRKTSKKTRPAKKAGKSVKKKSSKKRR